MFYVNIVRNELWLERVPGLTLNDILQEKNETLVSKTYHDQPIATSALSKELGRVIAKLHTNQIVHGDLTSSNVILRVVSDPPYWKICMIDFGLANTTPSAEDCAVDLYVLERALASTHHNSDCFMTELLKAYGLNNPGADAIIKKLENVRQRGRKRDMTG